MALMSEPVASARSALALRLRGLGRALLHGIVAARVRQLARTLRHRREAEILAGLDEHMLADIGLNRADLRDAFSEPIWRDPTSMLGRRADERRVGSRRPSARSPQRPRAGEPAFTRPRLDRSARLSL
jgi:uncharacterized protein YjiS (DUF1127 family)